MKKIIKIFILFVLILFIAFWGLSILKCEILTYLYGEQFAQMYREYTMIDDIDYFKVLNYSKDSARVYYVGLERSSGSVLRFCKENGNWRNRGWNVIWSTSGSADGFMWPYIR
ncbi:MAG: hypothetical protein E7411_07080 [Ruminococcaceae bacterium]|nr:hypothetical protein [Oscillospiraceae bacterium]